MNLVFATNNPHKINEVQRLVGDKIRILSLDAIDCKDELPEPYYTLRENALSKASYIKEKYKIDCFAEDTGLEVEALGGAPGIRSARYAGEEKNMEANIDLLLQKLKGVRNRKALFRTVIALLLNEEQFFFEGIVEGKIEKMKKGHNGFGYDPVFTPMGYEQSFAEMSYNLKNSISHRAKAVKKLIAFLKKEDKS